MFLFVVGLGVCAALLANGGGEVEAAVHNEEQFRSKVESGNLIRNSLNKGRNFSIKSRNFARESGSYS